MTNEANPIQLKEEISKFLEGDIEDSAEVLKEYSRDASLFEVKPQLVVFPKSEADIKAMVAFVNKNKEARLSLTARSGGTDMTGGPLTESIVLDFKRYFTKIGNVEGQNITTQPGAYYRDFEATTLEKDLIMPSYPASREICTVGGMVANNSGGEKTLSYGKTEKYVRRLNVILRDGEEYTLEPLNKQELLEKMQLTSFEGQFYRQTYELVNNNYELLQNAKPKVSKNSAGYGLWNVWNKETFDLTQLFIGSQGTLGVITDITFKLIKPKKHSKMLVILLKDLDRLSEIVQKVRRYEPESFESYDDHTLKLAVRFLPQMMKQMRMRDMLRLGWQFLPEMKMVLTGGMPKLILMAEFTGDDVDEIQMRATAAKASLEEFKLNTHLTKDASESAKYWKIRRESFNLLRKHVKDKHTAPFIDDIIVRPEQLPKFLPRLNAIMEQYDIIYTIAGHVGDANFHIIPLMNLADPNARAIIPELSHKVYELVFEFNGSITGEHNDGLIRTPFLQDMYGPKVCKLFQEAKTIFDPDNIFNPGKKVGSDWDYAMDHLVEE